MDVDYDICFSTQNMDEDELFRLNDELKNAEGVYKGSYQAIFLYSCAIRVSDFTDRYREFAGYSSLDEKDNLSLTIQFIEDSEYLRFIEDLGLRVEEYTGENAKMTAVAKANIYDEEAEKYVLFDMFAERAVTFFVTPEITGETSFDQEQNIDITFVDTIPLDTLPRAPSAPQSTVFMIVAPYQLKKNLRFPEYRGNLA